MVKIEICCGTACYLLGAERLMSLDVNKPESWNGRVEIEAVHCLELCNDVKNLGGAPFVRLNGSEIITKATPEKVVAAVENLLNSKEDAK